MAIETIIGLVVAGVLLFVAEVFVPGGILGAMGAVLVAVGVVGGFQHDTVLGMVLLFGSVLFGVLTFVAWVKFFPRTAMGKNMFLQKSGKDWHGYDDAKKSLLGARGTAHSPLRPAGLMLLDGKRIDVVTHGEMIAKGAEVVVTEVAGNRVVVEAIAADADSQ